jgi:hypothetical protein
LTFDNVSVKVIQEPEHGNVEKIDTLLFIECG